MTGIANIPAALKRAMTRHGHYAVLALNLAVFAVIAALAVLHDRQHTEQVDLIGKFHSVAIYKAQAARRELLLLDRDIRTPAVLERSPGANGKGANGGAPREFSLADRLFTLSESRQAMVDLQRQFDKPRFREITSLTTDAFSGVLDALEPPFSGPLDPAALDALALLEIRLEQFERMHIVAAERAEIPGNLLFAIGEKTLSALFLLLMALTAYVSFGIVRRLDIVGNQRAAALTGLSNSQAQLDAFFAMAPLGMCLFDRDLRYVKVNQGLADINGLTISENLGKTPGEILPENVADLIETSARHCLATGEKLTNAESIRIYPGMPDRPHHRMLSVFPIAGGGSNVSVGMTVVDVTDVKMAESALRDSEARLAAFFTEAPAGLGIVDSERRYVIVNDTLAQMNGVTIEQNIGKRPSEFMPPEMASTVDSVMARTLDRGERIVNEMGSATGPDGAAKHWVYSQFPIPGLGDDSGALGIVVVDMTEQRAAEQQMQHLAESLNNAQRIARLGSWNWNIADGTLSWSDEMYRIAGLDREATPTIDGFMQAIHPTDRERVQEAEGQALANGRPYSIEFRLIRSDGEIRIVQQQVEVEFDAAGEPAVMRGTNRDITEQKQTEIDLQNANENLTHAQQLAKIGSWTWDLDFGEYTGSDEIYRIYGLDRDGPHLTLKDFLERVHPDDRKRYEATVRDSVEHGQSFLVSYRILHPDGSELIVEEHGEALNTNTGAVPMFHGTVQDITERENTRQALARLNAELEQRVEDRTAELRAAQEELVKNERLATMGRLTATVSHELRNPLGAMRTSMYVVEKKVDPEDQRLHGAIDRVNRNITRCDQIIDELLDYTRIRDLDLRPTDIDEWLGTVLDEQNIPDGITVKRKFAVSSIRFPIDSNRLRRAFINILENACQAVADPHQEGAMPQRPLVTVETGLKKDKLEITISDNGPGIPPENQDRIFEPLFSTKNFGVGLGLPTVKQIMEQHGGGVEIGNRRGGGAKFALWLPPPDKLESEDA